MSSPFSIVVACDAMRGIGRAGTLPWRLPEDMAYFKRITCTAPEGLQNAVIMGRKTFESIPERFRPLPDRYNIVLSRDASYVPSGAVRAGSLDEALKLVDAHPDLADAFVVGGEALYREALKHPDCRRVHVTRVRALFACDTFLPTFEQDFVLRETHEAALGQASAESIAYTFEVYTRREIDAL